MRLFLLLWLTAFFFVCKGDENPCKNALYNANKSYDNGKFQEAISLLEPCVLNRNLSGDEQFDATRLLAICYAYLNEGKKAEEYIIKMLHIRPDYQKHPYVDPGDLRTILNRYSVNNTLDLGLETGINFNQARIIKNYSAADTRSTYRARAGFHAGVLAEYRANNHLSILLNPNYNSMSYLREMENVAGSKKEFTELMMNIEIPLACRMYFGKKSWRYYFQAGFHWDYLIKSFADVQSTNLQDGSVFQSSTETTPYRNRSIYGFNAGAGISAPLGKGTLSMGCDFKYFLPNYTIESSRYDNVDFILNSQYIDSDFSMNSLNFKVSYQLPFLYSVKKN